MSRAAGILALGLVLAFVLVFTRLNGSERVTLDLGVATFFRVPMPWVAFGSLLLGMGIMLLAGLHADLKVRRFLRDRLAQGDADEEDRERTVDRLQQDLFQGGPLPMVTAPVAGAAPEPEPRSVAPPESTEPEARLEAPEPVLKPEPVPLPRPELVEPQPEEIGAPPPEAADPVPEEADPVPGPTRTRPGEVP